MHSGLLAQWVKNVGIIYSEGNFDNYIPSPYHACYQPYAWFQKISKMDYRVS